MVCGDGSCREPVPAGKKLKNRSETEHGLYPGKPLARHHLFPSRTQKLSLSTLIVLGWKRPGRVGRRRNPWRSSEWMVSFFCVRLPQSRWRVTAPSGREPFGGGGCRRGLGDGGIAPTGNSGYSGRHTWRPYGRGRRVGAGGDYGDQTGAGWYAWGGRHAWRPYGRGRSDANIVYYFPEVVLKRRSSSRI